MTQHKKDVSISVVVFVGLFSFFFWCTAGAQERPPAGEHDGVTWSAYVDLYYAKNFNNPSGNTGLRYYDIYHDQVGLNLAELTVQKQTAQTGFLVDLDFGTEADLNAAVSNGVTTSVDEVFKHIGQAYVSYRPKFARRLSFDLGKMYTHVGLEGLKAKEDWQYSRSSTSTYGGPIFHVGLHAAYELVPGLLTTSGYFYNSSNTVVDNNAGKTVGAQVKLTPLDGLSMTYNYLGGPELPNDTSVRRTLHDAVLVYAISKRFSLASELLHGSEGHASWRSFVGAAKVDLFSSFSISPRFEVYRDLQGLTLGGGSQTLRSYTLTNSLKIDEHLETRLEFRHDDSSLGNRFLKKTGVSDRQSTLTFAVLYVF